MVMSRLQVSQLGSRLAEQRDIEMRGIMATQRKILFYDAETRAGATALIDEGAQLQEQHEFEVGTFSQRTHIIANDRMILFYDADTRAGATALIDEGAQLQE